MQFDREGNPFPDVVAPEHIRAARPDIATAHDKWKASDTALTARREALANVDDLEADQVAAVRAFAATGRQAPAFKPAEYFDALRDLRQDEIAEAKKTAMADTIAYETVIVDAYYDVRSAVTATIPATHDRAVNALDELLSALSDRGAAENFVRQLDLLAAGGDHLSGREGTLARRMRDYVRLAHQAAPLTTAERVIKGREVVFVDAIARVEANVRGYQPTAIAELRPLDSKRAETIRAEHETFMRNL